MVMDDHFERVAADYESLRTTDEAPVRRIGQLLPDRPVVGLDIGCGTGRYSRLLCGLLPAGSLLVASDISAAMLAELMAGNDHHGSRVVPLLSTAEELPWRTACLDLVIAFNCVHHFDLGRFLTAVARVLRPDGWLCIYTRTPEQNARTIWGRHFPGFIEREQRLYSEAALRDAVRQTSGLQVGRDTDLHAPAFDHGRATQGPGRGSSLLDLLAIHTGRITRVYRNVRDPSVRSRGFLGRRAPPAYRPREPAEPGSLTFSHEPGATAGA